ncbi:hypothetical protein Tco_0501786 [Tanacetum coccineum]
MNGKTKWPACRSNDDGLCNDGEFPGMLQDYWWKVNDHECSPSTNSRDHIRGPYANYYSNVQDEEEQKDKERCELFDDPAQEPSIYKIRRFEMIKYSFGQEEEYAAIKEYEYNDSTRTNEDTCRAYQEIFRNMKEGCNYGVLDEYSKRRAFWSLNEDILKINDSDNQYAVSIKEDTAYPCLHSPKDHKGNKLNTPYPERPIRRFEDIVCEDSGRYQTWSLLKETPIRRIQPIRYALSNRLPDNINRKLKNKF